MTRRTTSCLAALLAVCLLALAPAASALSPLLEQAKRDGVVGEQSDGYLGFPKGDAPGDVKKAVQEVNAQRKQVYEKTAAKQGTDAKTFAAVVGKRQVDGEPRGNWVKTSSGWTRK